MHNTRFLSIASLCLSGMASAQSAETLTPQVRNFVAVSDSVVALTNVTIIDGTGSAPRTGQTIVIRGNRIADVGRELRLHPRGRDQAYERTPPRMRAGAAGNCVRTV